MVTQLEIKRYLYTSRTTIGKLYVDGEFFCYTLEDTVRGRGIKVKKETAIPEGVLYDVTIRTSPKYGDVPVIWTEDDHISIEARGISFKYVLIHGGNSHVDTEGCVLVAKNLVNSETIQGSMKREITELIKNKIAEGNRVVLLITNEIQNEK